MARNQAIDGLRAFAIGAVLAAHFLPGYFPGGGLGVDLFFVISGFVITRSLIAAPIDLKAFYVRRIRRLWPALWLLCAFVAVVGPAFDPAAPANVVFALTGTMNWARAFRGDAIGGSLGHAWSLGIEEQFYLLWAPGLAMLVKRRKLIVPLLSGLIVTSMAWHELVATVSPGFAYNDLFSRAGELLLGCLIAWTGPREFRRFWPVPLAGLTLASLIPGVPLPVIAVFSAALVGAAAPDDGWMSRVMRWPPIQWAGLRSYSLYLWHYPLEWYLSRLPLPEHARFVVIVAATFGAAELSYRFVEQRFRVRREVSGIAAQVIA